MLVPATTAARRIVFLVARADPPAVAIAPQQMTERRGRAPRAGFVEAARTTLCSQPAGRTDITDWL